LNEIGKIFLSFPGFRNRLSTPPRFWDYNTPSRI